MTNQKKGAQIGVFHILKSVVDAKVPVLQDRVSAGKRAQTEYPILVDNIKALRQYVMNSRTFDPSEYYEAAADLDDKEMQLDGIQNRIVRGQHAEQDLKIVQQFNSNYNSACKIHKNASRIRALQELFDELCEQQYCLDEKVAACEVNMDSASRLPEFIEQAHADAAKYREEYNELEKRMSKIKEQINQLTK